MEPASPPGSGSPCPHCGKSYATANTRNRHSTFHCSSNPGRLEPPKRERQRQRQKAPRKAAVPGGEEDAGGGSAFPQSTQKTRCIRQEDLSHVKHEAVRKLIKRHDLHSALQELIRLIYQRPVNRNVRVTTARTDEDPTTRLGSVFVRGEWRPRRAWFVARLVALNAASVMCEHNDDPYQSEFTDEETRRFDAFYEALDEDDREGGQGFRAIRATLETLEALETL